MHRLDTDQGSFAVKKLNLGDRRESYRTEDVFRFERAAFAAGVPMPEQISASYDTLVHRWVKGEKVPEAPGVGGVRVRDRYDPRPHPRARRRVVAPAQRGATARDWPQLAEERRRPASRGRASSPPSSRYSSRSPDSSTPASDLARPR